MSRLNQDMVRQYLQEISRFPLLSAEQEIAYSRQIQQMIAIEQATSALKQKLHREPMRAELAADVGKDETELNRIQQLGQRAKQKMVTSNLRLVVSIAKKYQWSKLELLDLLQEGAIGLQRGVEKFDPNRGYKFSTYAYWWIREAIMRAIAEKSRTVRLPVHLTEKFVQIRKVQRELSQKLGRRASTEEIAQVIGVEPQQMREYLGAFRPLVSLEKPVGEEREMELQEIIPSDSISIDELVTQECLREDLAKLLAFLKPIQREVLILRYGLDSERQLTAQEVAQQLNISPQKVRQIQQQVMNTLRRFPNDIRLYLAS
ncbi:group 2 sigma 70-type sigma factor (plasmid) [Tolypothrix tenuis PCC 7101]|uniref:Group 2 sigma 70-type sigma factor n=1 Tax=Tolypothrix tenuis PCC 7101 TaxID=231146 RepID=A0A1Z4NB96_9CYAN|nr:RNA polymerase sigma factor, RpoD/SigA family [Aulosira sp. FACHB-113]BAZ02955.1 group 2 sigma 70-type sigma factor [Tolypothrix tenuis PCC 7101]BAZ78122.1 group 2 sigma 70-type sigma factor [Aulosira laxa NIES-50]